MASAGKALFRTPLEVQGDAGQTVANLLAAELPFRLSILADVAMALADVGLGVLLFFLLKPVSHTLSLMAMAFRLTQAAILGLNLLNLYTAVSLARGTAFATGPRDALVTSFLGAHAAGYDLGLFFFALNCLLVGLLVFRAGFLPRAVGVMLALFARGLLQQALEVGAGEALQELILLLSVALVGVDELASVAPGALPSSSWTGDDVNFGAG